MPPFMPYWHGFSPLQNLAWDWFYLCGHLYLVTTLSGLGVALQDKPPSLWVYAITKGKSKLATHSTFRSSFDSCLSCSKSCGHIDLGTLLRSVD